MRFKAETNGHKFSGNVALPDKGGPPVCTECFRKLVIPCAYCGLPICPGDPITLYRKKAEYQPPKDAVCYDGNAYVGCLRCGCAMTGADRAGFWLPDNDALPEVVGHVARVPNILEMIAKQMQEGDGMIVIGDLSELPKGLLEILPPELRPPQEDDEKEE